jgi:hypothetical protein
MRKCPGDVCSCTDSVEKVASRKLSQICQSTNDIFDLRQLPSQIDLELPPLSQTWMMRSPTSASETRTYGAEKIGSSRYLDFFNRIAPTADGGSRRRSRRRGHVVHSFSPLPGRGTPSGYEREQQNVPRPPSQKYGGGGVEQQRDPCHSSRSKRKTPGGFARPGVRFGACVGITPSACPRYHVCAPRQRRQVPAAARFDVGWSRNRLCR